MIIGLTGGIGSGKSTIAKLFEIMGCIIYQSDDVAKQLYFEAPIQQQIIQLLGKEAYINPSKINTSFISQKIFSDTTLLHELNTIIHPAVKLHFEQFVKANPNRVIVKETALLFESNLYKDLDYSVLVTAPVELRIERVMKRNTLSRHDVEERIQSQWSDEQKLPLASFVIVNDQTSALIPQVIAITEKIKKHV